MYGFNYCYNNVYNSKSLNSQSFPIPSSTMDPLAAMTAMYSHGSNTNNNKQQHHQYNSARQLCCLRLRGLPFSATSDDIVSFMDTQAANIKGTPHIIYNLQGRPSGEAFVQMENVGEAKKAASSLHLKHMGERYIEVFCCSVYDMSLVLATSHANQLSAQRSRSTSNYNEVSLKATQQILFNQLQQQAPYFNANPFYNSNSPPYSPTPVNDYFLQTFWPMYPWQMNGVDNFQHQQNLTNAANGCWIQPGFQTRPYPYDNKQYLTYYPETHATLTADRHHLQLRT